MSYPGVFAESIIAEKLDLLNVCFLVDTVRRAYGGTAGNIGYNLNLLGEKALIVASVGDDPDGADYLKRLAGWNFPLETIKTAAGRMTAGCTIATDAKNNQIIFFHAGAMNVSTGFDPSALPGPATNHLAIVSPGGHDEMKKLCADYRGAGLKFIFDPGQQIPSFSGPELLEMLEGAHIFICNEYEFELFKKLTGLSVEDMFRHAEIIIVTNGAKGSSLMTPGRGSQHVMAAPVRRVVNPTGAGDAFRAGLLKGLAAGEALISACRLGAVVAAFCVEADGTQEHGFTIGEATARYAGVFNEQIRL
jgi:adenosine kinase